MKATPCIDCGKTVHGARCKPCAAAFKRDPSKPYKSRLKSGSGHCIDCNSQLGDMRSRRCLPCRNKSFAIAVCGVCGSTEPKKRTPGGKRWCPNCARIKSQRKYYSLTTAEERKARAGKPDTIRKNRLKQKAKRRGQFVIGGHTTAEWEAIKKKQGGKCVHCHLVKKLTRDHITPREHGGCDYAFNIQGLCGPCNSSKCDSLRDVIAFSLFDRLVA